MCRISLLLDRLVSCLAVSQLVVQPSSKLSGSASQPVSQLSQLVNELAVC